MGWIDVNGVNTRYITSGNKDKEPILLLHGTAGSLENFCANYGELGKDHYVIGIDLLGCGYTDKPDKPYLITDYAEHALGVLDALNITKAHIIGVSLGSWVGARMASSAPERVGTLTMIAPAGIVVDADEEKAFGQDVRARRKNAAQAPSWESVSTAMGRLMLKQEDLIDDLIAVRLAIYEQPELQAAMSHLLEFTRGDQHLTVEEWASLETPILAYAAVDAPNMFLDNAYAIGKTAPNAEVVEIPNSDHWGQFEQPERFHSTTIPFIAQHPLTHPEG